MRPIHFDNLWIEVTRKPIRNLRMRICPPDAVVRVSAPLYVSDAEVLRFVTAREAWIRRHRDKILARQARIAPVQGLQGETVRVWGQPYSLEFTADACGGDALADGFLRVPAPCQDNAPARLKTVRTVLRKILAQRVSELAGIWTPVMGVPRPELRIKRMKTRWGTCNPTASRVWINAELVHRMPECLEYVLVHELAHLLERGHTDRFWSIVESHVPDWKFRKQMLNGD